MAEKILIVIDMQNDFIDGSLGTKEAAAIVARAAEKIRTSAGRIFVTLDTHGTDYLQTPEGRKLPVEHCIKGTEGWHLNREIKRALEGKNYMQFEKNTFGSLALAEEISRIHAQEPVEAELIGLCTDICVVSNALLLKAYAPGMRICVDAGCCAGVTPRSHRAALETMGMCQIDITGEDGA